MLAFEFKYREIEFETERRKHSGVPVVFDRKSVSYDHDTCATRIHVRVINIVLTYYLPVGILARRLVCQLSWWNILGSCTPYRPRLPWGLPK